MSADTPEGTTEIVPARHTRLLRVAEHVRTQNWTAIGIDFLIVVLGVFVGIQVVNWNAARVDKQRGAEFTERLRADLSEERWIYGFLTAYYGDVREAAGAAAGALEGTAPLSDHDLLVAAYRATQYREGPRRRATYDELVSTGSLGLVADTELLRVAEAVYRTQTGANAAREGMESPYRQLFRMGLSNDVQRELARRCGDRPVRWGESAYTDSIIDYPCTLDLPTETIDAAAAALRSDAELLRALRRRVADLDTRMFDFTSNNLPAMERLDAALDDAR
jgi:hypothetical protein